MELPKRFMWDLAKLVCPYANLGPLEHCLFKSGFPEHFMSLSKFGVSETIYVLQ